MSRNIHRQYPAPQPLRAAASSALDAYQSHYDEDDLQEAVARVHHAAREKYPNFAFEGPHAYADRMLVFSTTREQWDTLCASVKVYGDANLWCRRAMQHAADRVAKADNYLPEGQVKIQYDGEDECPVVIEHP